MANQLSNIYPTTSCWHHVFIQPHKQPVAVERWQKIACGRWSCFLSWCSFRYIMWISRKLVPLVFTYVIYHNIYVDIQDITVVTVFKGVPSDCRCFPFRPRTSRPCSVFWKRVAGPNGWTALGETCRTHVDLCGFKMLWATLAYHSINKPGEIDIWHVMKDIWYMDELSMTSRSDGSLE